MASAGRVARHLEGARARVPPGEAHPRRSSDAGAWTRARPAGRAAAWAWVADERGRPTARAGLVRHGRVPHGVLTLRWRPPAAAGARAGRGVDGADRLPGRRSRVLHARG